MISHSPELRLPRPGALIAALPAVLGFAPENSLVLVSLHDGDIDAVIRVDLSRELTEHSDQLAAMLADSHVQTTIAVIVDAANALGLSCIAECRDLCDDLAAALQRYEISLTASYVVDHIAAGAHWYCGDGCGAYGLVEDPAASPLAVAAVLEGRRLYGRRADVQAFIDVADISQADALAKIISEFQPQRWAQRCADLSERCRRDITAVLTAAHNVCHGGHLGDTELAELACAITDAVVRDMLYALAVGPESGPVEALWALLARSLPNPWRVEALTLLALTSYARGDGVLAGVTLGAALYINSAHHMASMLHMALRSGIRPEHICELAATGYDLANRLDVWLPPRCSPF